MKEMVIATATVEIRWEESCSKFAILKLIEYLEKKELIGMVVKIEVVE